MEAEAAEVTDASDVAIVVERPERAGGVLDQPQGVLIGDRLDGSHVRGEPEEMDGNDPDGAGRDLGLDL